MTDKEYWALVVDVGRILLERIKAAVHDEDFLITYGDLAGKLSYEVNPRNLDHPLGELSDLCKELELPLISTIVINKESYQPGAGYFKYFFPGNKEADWIRIFNELYDLDKQCRDWTPLSEELGIS